MKGYNPQRNGEFQQGGVVGALLYPCSGETQGHQHRLQLFCHPFRPMEIEQILVTKKGLIPQSTLEI